MATKYESTTYSKRNDLPSATYTEACPALDRNALIDNPNRLIAYPDDASIRPLAAMMGTNPPLRNILVSARHIWWQGYCDNIQHSPSLPHSAGNCVSIETVMRVVDSAFRANAIHNVISLSIGHFTDLLADAAAVPVGWPTNNKFYEWLLEQVHQPSPERSMFEQEVKRNYPDLDKGVMPKIATFIVNLKKRPHEVSIDDIKHVLKSKSVAPHEWPQHHSMGAYIFINVFMLPLDETNQLIPDMDSAMDAAAAVNKLNQADGDEEDEAGHQGQGSEAFATIQDFILEQRRRIEQMIGMAVAPDQSASAPAESAHTRARAHTYLRRRPKSPSENARVDRGLPRPLPG